MKEKCIPNTIPVAWHIQVARSLAYLAVIWLVLLPLVGWFGCLTASLSVPLAILLGYQAHQLGLRWIVSLGACGLVFAASFLAIELVETTAAAYVFGPHRVIPLAHAIQFGTATLCLVCALQILSQQWRTLTILETVGCVLPVVIMFCGHHDSNLGQPREFAEWAMGSGYDPRLLLRVIGVGLVAVTSILMLRAERVQQTVPALICLCLLLMVAFQASFLLAPDRDTPDSRSSLRPPSQQQESNPKQDESKSKDDSDHGDGQIERDSLPFDPKQWPNQPTPMAIVNVHNDYKPSSGQYYFRQHAYSQFNGGKLVKSTESGLDGDVAREFVVEPTLLSGPSMPADMTVSVPLTISLLKRHTSPFALVTPQRLEPRPNLDSSTFERTYFVHSEALSVDLLSPSIIGRKSGNPSWNQAQQAHYVAGPSDPRYKALADEILASNHYEKVRDEFRDADMLKALSIRRWMEKNIVYTTRVEDQDPSVDPVASCLFETRKGYCVHVAHAMTYLLRSLGIASRVAGGYAAEAGRMGSGNGLMLVSTDMHAWCEIYLEGLGWQVMDAVLEQSESPSSAPVDLAVQQFLSERNRETRSLDSPVLADPVQLSSKTIPWPLGFVVVLSLYSLKVWRRMIPYLSSSKNLHRTCYRAALDRLAEVGFRRQYGETREEFADRVRHVVPEFTWLSAAHVRQSLTGQVTHSRELWLAQLQTVSHRIRLAFPRQVWLRGLGNPLSWLQSR